MLKLVNRRGRNPKVNASWRKTNSMNFFRNKTKHRQMKTTINQIHRSSFHLQLISILMRFLHLLSVCRSPEFLRIWCRTWPKWCRTVRLLFLHWKFDKFSFRFSRFNVDATTTTSSTISRSSTRQFIDKRQIFWNDSKRFEKSKKKRRSKKVFFHLFFFFFSNRSYAANWKNSKRN